MGNIGRLRSSPLMMVSPSFFTAAALDDTGGEQMCGSGFTEKSDVNELLLHYFRVVSCAASQATNKSSESLSVVNSMFAATQQLTRTHYYANYSVLLLALLLVSFHNFPAPQQRLLFPLLLLFVRGVC